MDAEYKRELSRTYLRLKAEYEINEDSYEIKMIQANHIPGILPMTVLHLNQAVICQYDVTSLQPLSVFCSANKLHRRELCEILTSLISRLLIMEDYLLDLNCLVLEADKCFLKWDSKDLSLPYLPGSQSDLRLSLQMLMEYLLRQIPQDDRDTIVLAYRIYHELQNETLQLTELRQFLAAPDPAGQEIEASVPPFPVSAASDCFARGSGVQTEPAVKKKRRFSLSLPFFRRKKQALDDPLCMPIMPDNEPIADAPPLPRCVPPRPEENSCTVLLSARSEPSPKTVCLKPLSADKDLPTLDLTASDVLIGSQEGLSDLVIPSPAVSRVHARIFQNGSQYFIMDLSSKNGTFVDRRQLTGQEECPLTAGCTVTFADCIFRFTNKCDIL